MDRFALFGLVYLGLVIGVIGFATLIEIVNEKRAKNFQYKDIFDLCNDESNSYYIRGKGATKCKDFPPVTFEQFHSWYLVKPTSWEFQPECVLKKDSVGTAIGGIRFKTVDDVKKYTKWRIELKEVNERIRSEQEQNKIMWDILESVQSDIDKLWEKQKSIQDKTLKSNEEILKRLENDNGFSQGFNLHL